MFMKSSRIHLQNCGCLSQVLSTLRISLNTVLIVCCHTKVVKKGIGEHTGSAVTVVSAASAASRRRLHRSVQVARDEGVVVAIGNQPEGAGSYILKGRFSREISEKGWSLSRHCVLGGNARWEGIHQQSEKQASNSERATGESTLKRMNLFPG